MQPIMLSEGFGDDEVDITYDGSNRISTVVQKDAGTIFRTTTYNYNTDNTVNNVSVTTGSTTVTFTYTYTNGLLTKIVRS